MTRAIDPGRRKLKFHLSTVALFTVLTEPMLILVLSYSYFVNSRNLISMLNAAVVRLRDDGIATATSLPEPVHSTFRIIAEVAASNPQQGNPISTPRTMGDRALVLCRHGRAATRLPRLAQAPITS